MAGMTGKRARPAKLCQACQKAIEGAFMREKDCDYHQACWWAKRGGK